MEGLRTEGFTEGLLGPFIVGEAFAPAVRVRRPLVVFFEVGFVAHHIITYRTDSYGFMKKVADGI